MVTDELRAWSAVLPLITAGTAGVTGLEEEALLGPPFAAALEEALMFAVLLGVLLPALPFSGDTEAVRALPGVTDEAGAGVEETTGAVVLPVEGAGAGVFAEALAAEA